MSGKLRLNGATSGYSELQAPDVAGDQTFTLPAVGGELVTKQGGGQVVGYQQGVWTPALNENVSDISEYQNTWSRIGQTVFLNCRVQFAAPNNSAYVEILNLPYPAPASITEGNSVFAASALVEGQRQYFTQESVANNMSVYMSSNSSLYVYWSSSSGNYSRVRWSSFGTGIGAIISSIQYITEDTTFVPINGATIS
jgi:hypothetical protein